MSTQQGPFFTFTQQGPFFTKQETFDTVAKGLLAQGGPSASFGRCRYRAVMADGSVRKCAVGFLISDKDYYPEMEKNLDGAAPEFIEEGHNIDLVLDLQRAHDKAYSYSNRSEKEWLYQWRTIMFNLASNYDLDTDVLYN